MTATKRKPVPAVAVMALVMMAAVFVAAWKWGNWSEEVDTPSGSTSGESGEATEVAAWSHPVIAKTVLQVENYTYVELMPKPGETVWVASPKFNVNVGDRVVVRELQGELQDFHSKTLDRTFKEILFVGAAGVVDDQDRLISVSQEHAAVDAAHGHRASGEAAPQWDPLMPSLEKPPGGYTIAELYASAKSLAGKTVKIRGLVVKATPGVLGKNWYHLQDGSGDAETGDITVTSAEKVELGEIVVVSGKLEVDRDVGAGYSFPLLIEDASVVR